MKRKKKKEKKEKEKKGRKTRGKGKEKDEEERTMEEKRRNKSKKKTLFDPRSSRVRAVCRCVCPALSHSFPFCLFCSRARIRTTAARCCSRSMLEYITRRDLYSRLTSLCEGRIRSDTSLVCTSTVQPCVFDSLPRSLSLSFLLPLSSFLLPLLSLRSSRTRSSVRWFHCDGLHPALSALPSSPRLHEGPIRRL